MKNAIKPLTANKAALLAAVKAYASANYENGWDTVVECYTDEDILEIIGESFKAAGAISKVAKVVIAQAAQEYEIVNA